jgi:acyl carrier protein
MPVSIIKNSAPTEPYATTILTGLTLTDYETIKHKLFALIGEKTKLNAEDVHPELNLEASGLDSFARIELVLIIEDAFDVEFSDAESADIATVDDIIKSLEAKTGGA